MSIFRIKKRGNFVTVDKTVLDDKRLSWKAKGIIMYMLSKPDDWVFYINEITKHSTDGERAFRSGLKELKENGYVSRFPVFADGKIDHWETLVFETPQQLDQHNLHIQNVQVDNVYVENEALLNINITNNDLTNNNITKDQKTSRHKYKTCDKEMAERLFSRMLDNNENAKKPNMESWANEFRLMREIDKRTEEQINYLIDWTQTDSFWKTNILSPAKLRKQFDQLVVKVKEQINKGNDSLKTKPKAYQSLQDWADEE